MPSHTDAGLRAVAVSALLVAALSVRASPVQQASLPANAASPGETEIARALATVRADPNLGSERTIKTLRWRSSAAAKPQGPPAWLAWIAGLFRWIEQSARVLVWGAAMLLAGLLVVYILRTVRWHGMPRLDAPFVPPTHVRDLDIRPETLPLDIGAAARVLWDRGEHRAALALLYRGLLSRLAHVYDVPIRDSSTEGDCLAMAASRLTPANHEYASRLVGVWERCVYGREQERAAIVHALCDDFASVLDGSRLEAIASRGTA